MLIHLPYKTILNTTKSTRKSLQEMHYRPKNNINYVILNIVHSNLKQIRLNGLNGLNCKEPKKKKKKKEKKK